MTTMSVCYDCQQSTTGYCWRHANVQFANYRPAPPTVIKDPELAKLVAELARFQNERDRWHRLFNRIEAAISHHKRDCEANDVPDTHDEALWAARDRILRDSAEGKG